MTTERRYAEGTTVPVSRSRDEVYRLLERYGAREHLIGGDATRVVVAFSLHGYAVRLHQSLPVRAPLECQAAHEREVRRRWRVLILLLKSRLELVAAGAETVAQAFMPYLVLPGGATAGEWFLPGVDDARRTGAVPDTQLPAGPPAKVIALPERSGGAR